ncbi:MAG: hypothetical protein NC299_06485 [Lachnospiraceae bacterium]|nr:hypothetical protein [Ruminococcus sp.]MCM1275001.1 hypothetical protein [Lachnospiraceae bacterium]
MPRTKTTYDVLLSCPGDVYNDCYSTIDDTVNVFNKVYGDLYNIEINLVHWSKDSFPQSGDHPQELLNKQIVDDADACIAVFWTKFGSPTDKYGSGTEEEIERMLSENRQVFVYFYNKPVPPSLLANEETKADYNKISEFKKKYSKRGIYSEISDETDFQKKLTVHLTKFFLGKQDTASITSHEITPVLRLVGKDKQENVAVSYTNLLNDSKIEGLKKSIADRIEELNKYRLNACSLDSEIEENPILANLGIGMWEYKPVTVKPSEKEVIESFCRLCGISLSENFWDLGDLKTGRQIFDMNIYGNKQVTLFGTDDEQFKYNRIKSISSDIFRLYKLYLYQEFYKTVDKIPFIELAVFNSGTTFDQDVEVKLFFEKDVLFDLSEFPRPDDTVIEEFVEKESNISLIICPGSTSELSDYTYPNQSSYAYSPRINLRPADIIKKAIEEYYTTIDEYDCFDYYEENGKDILKVNFKEVKQHTGVMFPVRLFLSNVPDEIPYQITGKNSPDVINGTVKIINV